ncbi:hypothetical protein [Aeromonas jandaei]|uniref:hypothetical protein n=1 Tax=Aeromonas jandaei TaxID=650 RepID=UPI003EC6C2CE
MQGVTSNEKYKSVIAFSIFLLFFQRTAFADTSKCINSNKLVYLEIGYTDVDPDSGNSIIIGHVNAYGELNRVRVNRNANLNDNGQSGALGRGAAMYHSLASALAFGHKVSAWNHSGNCDSIDEIKIEN